MNKCLTLLLKENITSVLTEFLADVEFNNFHITNDYSDTITNKGKNPVEIPIPKFAMINMTNENGNLPWPWSKKGRSDYQKGVNADLEATIEYIDSNGNYFMKNIVFTGQGNSSMAFLKKNSAIKIFDDSIYNASGKFGKGDGFGIKFGNWVVLTGFHTKAYYTDYLRGAAVVSYQLADEIYKTRGYLVDRPWKKAMLESGSTPEEIEAADDGARCMPDGFPVICYLNGKFYGVESWLLKKDLANYHLDKDIITHIHLDGDLYGENLWNGTVNWSAFEIRNPEDLVCMDGSDYDGDYPAELIDVTSPHYDSTNEDHVRSAAVKQYIINLSKRVREINTLNSSDSEAAKELFNTYFDSDNLVDYEIINMVIGDADGFGKNWQWITYDGIKWYVCQYDKDMSFGNHFSGTFTTNPKTGWIGNSNNLPTGLSIRYDKNKYKERWNELVDANIININNVKEKLYNWYNRVGGLNFAKEWKRWPVAPPNRDPKIDTNNWEFLHYYTTTLPSSNIWSVLDTYNIGNEVWFKGFDGNLYYRFRSKTTNTNKPCLIGMYSEYPKTMGYFDNLFRFYDYTNKTILNQTLFINSIA